MSSSGTNSSRRPESLRLPVLAAAALATAAALMSACSDQPETELTVETQLEALAGEDLTPAEIARQVEIASTLCGMSDDVLVAIWDQLDEGQLAFQDFVFGSHCPERSVTYGLATGRTLTPEARVAAAEQQSESPAGTSSTVLLPESSLTTRATAPVTEQPGPSISIATDG